MIYYSGESSALSVIMTLICFWYLFKVYAPKIEKEKNKEILESINKTHQEIRHKAGCKDIHAWNIKNI
ncbi:hypothetical protein [Campylobacter sp.]|uniref:hypothetical protein n=1 Tax=Campylobacter sp. TaxID=205 RepID=UPI002A8292E7|nr:hypothetical protein [Campylobacter sp.]MCI7236610.1 hypothetical protein [Campylobacter sp.]MDY4013750.1 hypothetical protein [Campylobacter sp.]MDY4804194.1 hypothetical protein [Campylobacter sp.]MDY4830601.1 hypothetical protein [Campylobacter sp.]